MKMKLNKKIAIVGLGYVGLPLAIAFGQKFSVRGYDSNRDRIEEIKSGIDRNGESSKDALLNSPNVSYTCNVEDISSCNFFVVSVPTPVSDDNLPNLRNLREATSMVGSCLKKGDIVVFESTVFPGTTNDICVPILEKESGLLYKEDFDCGYSPERINPGDKVNKLENVVKIVSGSTQVATDEISAIYSEIIEAGVYRADSIEVAEAAKIIENTQRDLNIAFMNEVSQIFNVLDIDTQAVLDAASTKWNFHRFNPGFVGGHCIGVDPYYLIFKANSLGIGCPLISTAREVNENMPDFAVDRIVNSLNQKQVETSKLRVLVLGVTFKENCPDIRNSKVFPIVENLKGLGLKVDVADPWADNVSVKNSYQIELCETYSENSYDIIVVSVGHSQYREMSIDTLNKFFRGDSIKILADFKSLYSKETCRKYNIETIRL